MSSNERFIVHVIVRKPIAYHMVGEYITALFMPVCNHYYLLDEEGHWFFVEDAECLELIGRA